MGNPYLSDDARHRIVCTLLENTVNGKPKYEILRKLGIEFNVTRKTIHNIWKAAQNQREAGVPINVNSRIAGKQGRRAISCPIDAIKAVDLPSRSTIKKLSASIGHSATTVGPWIRWGLIRSHTSSIHPHLTLENRFDRLEFVLSKLVIDRTNRNLKFREMDHIIHIDEKWFNMSKSTQRYYLVAGEDAPYRSCKSKNHIVKIMFLTAVSRPIYANDGSLLFDGKIGIFPLTFKEPAKRNSKNRVVGTMETKPIESVNKAVSKEFLINHIIPSIKSKWPETTTKNIIIQQDNAKPHIKGNDIDFIKAATSDGFNIQLTQQPANSLDLNVLDLGFFRSIQSLQKSKPTKTVEELGENVEFAYKSQTPECLDDVWLSWQACTIEIMKRKGHNDYKLPHMQKASHRRADTLPRNLTIDEELAAECMAYLIKNRYSSKVNDILREMGLAMDELEVILAANTIVN